MLKAINEEEAPPVIYKSIEEIEEDRKKTHINGLNKYILDYQTRMRLSPGEDEMASGQFVDKQGFYKALNGTTNPFNEYYEMK